MARDFHLPDLGEGVHEGQVLRLLVPAGTTVELDQPIMEVETDKAAVEIPSPFAGTIDAWHVAEKQLVNVGDLMVSFDDDAASAAAAKGRATKAAGTAATGSRGGGTATAAPGTGNGRPAGGGGGGGRRKPASPAVRKLARILEVDLARVEGSGPGGRILRKDVEAASKGGAAAVTAPAPSATTTAPSAPAPPAPTAPGAAPAPPPPTAAPAAGFDAFAAAAIPADAEEDTDAHGAFARAPLSQTRRAIARVMTDSVRTIPHVTDQDDADVTDLDALRRQYNGTVPDHERVGMLPFVLRAVARALQAFPILNASIEPGDERETVCYRRSVHVAVGMQTQRGLVAPVIRDCHAKGVRAIAADLAALTNRVRTGGFELADAAGATYTVSNAGAMGGSRYSTPIITPPQVAVLAVGRTRAMPWVVEGEVVPRKIMPLSHSMDHRLIDGAVEMAFLRHVIADLETPGRLLL